MCKSTAVIFPTNFKDYTLLSLPAVESVQLEEMQNKNPESHAYPTPMVGCVASFPRVLHPNAILPQTKQVCALVWKALRSFLTYFTDI